MKKGRHEGLPCCGDSLSHCVGNLWSEGSTSATCACRGFVRCLKSSCWDVGDVLVEKSTDGAGCQVLQFMRRVIRVAKWSVRDLSRSRV